MNRVEAHPSELGCLKSGGMNHFKSNVLSQQGQPSLWLFRVRQSHTSTKCKTTEHLKNHAYHSKTQIALASLFECRAQDGRHEVAQGRAG
eukprot:799206-Amphidinium_carterae.1